MRVRFPRDTISQEVTNLDACDEVPPFLASCDLSAFVPWMHTVFRQSYKRGCFREEKLELTQSQTIFYFMHVAQKYASKNIVIREIFR